MNIQNDYSLFVNSYYYPYYLPEYQLNYYYYNAYGYISPLYEKQKGKLIFNGYI